MWRYQSSPKLGVSELLPPRMCQNTANWDLLELCQPDMSEFNQLEYARISMMETRWGGKEKCVLGAKCAIQVQLSWRLCCPMARFAARFATRILWQGWALLHGALGKTYGPARAALPLTAICLLGGGGGGGGGTCTEWGAVVGAAVDEEAAAIDDDEAAAPIADDEAAVPAASAVAAVCAVAAVAAACACAMAAVAAAGPTANSLCKISCSRLN